MDPRLLGAYIFAAGFDILMPIALGLFVRRRLGVPWRYFWYGALIFFVFQIVTRVPAVQILQGVIAESLRQSEPLRWAWLFALALSAGLFEEVGRYVGYRFLVFRRGRLEDGRGVRNHQDSKTPRRGEVDKETEASPLPLGEGRGEGEREGGSETRPYASPITHHSSLDGQEAAWRKGVMYGLGHGGLESMLLVGGSVILAAINAAVILGMDPNSPAIPPEQVEAFRQARATLESIPWWYPLLGAVERLFTIPVHVALSVLVLQVFLRGSMRWLFLAILAHFAVNFIAVSSTRWLDPVATEALIGLFAAGALYLVFRLRPRAGAV